MDRFPEFYYRQNNVRTFEGKLMVLQEYMETSISHEDMEFMMRRAGHLIIPGDIARELTQPDFFDRLPYSTSWIVNTIAWLFRECHILDGVMDTLKEDEYTIAKACRVYLNNPIHRTTKGIEKFPEYYNSTIGNLDYVFVNMINILNFVVTQRNKAILVDLKNTIKVRSLADFYYALKDRANESDDLSEMYMILFVLESAITVGGDIEDKHYGQLDTWSCVLYHLTNTDTFIYDDLIHYTWMIAQIDEPQLFIEQIESSISISEKTTRISIQIPDLGVWYNSAHRLSIRCPYIEISSDEVNRQFLDYLAASFVPSKQLIFSKNMKLRNAFSDIIIINIIQDIKNTNQRVKSVIREGIVTIEGKVYKHPYPDIGLQEAIIEHNAKLAEFARFDFDNYISKLIDYRTRGNQSRMFINIRGDSIYFMEEESKMDLTVTNFVPYTEVQQTLDCESIKLVSDTPTSIYMEVIEPYFYPLQQLLFSKQIDGNTHNWSIALMDQIAEHISNYNGFIGITKKGIMIGDIEYIHPLKDAVQRMVYTHNEEVKINMLQNSRYIDDDFTNEQKEYISEQRSRGISVSSAMMPSRRRHNDLKSVVLRYMYEYTPQEIHRMHPSYSIREIIRTIESVNKKDG